MRTADEVMGAINHGLNSTDGAITIAHTEKGWLCGIEWDREADDSPMVGAAAYGMGETMGEAVEQALEEAQWFKRLESTPEFSNEANGSPQATPSTSPGT